MQDYDLSKPSTFISCLDANNLYDWPTSQYLPYGGWKWLRQKEINKFDIYSIAENGSISYILKVDLEYPHQL